MIFVCVGCGWLMPQSEWPFSTQVKLPSQQHHCCVSPCSSNRHSRSPHMQPNTYSFKLLYSGSTLGLLQLLCHSTTEFLPVSCYELPLGMLYNGNLHSASKCISAISSIHGLYLHVFALSHQVFDHDALHTASLNSIQLCQHWSATPPVSFFLAPTSTGPNLAEIRLTLWKTNHCCHSMYHPYSATNLHSLHSGRHTINQLQHSNSCHNVWLQAACHCHPCPAFNAGSMPPMEPLQWIAHLKLQQQHVWQEVTYKQQCITSHRCRLSSTSKGIQCVRQQHTEPGHCQQRYVCYEPHCHACLIISQWISCCPWYPNQHLVINLADAWDKICNCWWRRYWQQEVNMSWSVITTAL